MYICFYGSSEAFWKGRAHFLTSLHAGVGREQLRQARAAGSNWAMQKLATEIGVSIHTNYSYFQGRRGLGIADIPNVTWAVLLLANGQLSIRNLVFTDALPWVDSIAAIVCHVSKAALYSLGK